MPTMPHSTYSYISDTYDVSPEYSLSTYFDTDSFFDQPLKLGEMNPTDNPFKMPMPNPSWPATGTPTTGDQSRYENAYYQTPFGQIGYTPSYSIDPASINTAEPVPFSPITQSSRTSSMCGDPQEQAYSPSASPRFIKRESPFSPASQDDQAESKRPQRKRGRPRLDGIDAEFQASGSSSAKSQRTRRLPHNQVERKYREGLNSELERLRKAVPTLPHSDDGSAMNQPKPSKAMILSSAIEYIRSIEKERDALKEEVERLKQNRNHNMGWAEGNTSLDEFLMDL
jgi:hypothetical protein